MPQPVHSRLPTLMALSSLKWRWALTASVDHPAMSGPSCWGMR